MLTQTELDQIRKVTRELRARWAAVLPGESLELTFDPNQPAVTDESLVPS